MKRRVVFDSSAVIAFFRKERGSTEVFHMLNARRLECFIHAINVIEICYILANGDEEVASEIHAKVDELDVIIDGSLDSRFQKQCAFFKARFSMLSLADSVALSLGKRLNAEVITTDKEFSRAADLVKVMQLRPREAR